jgi:hypothetical protein
MHGLSRWAWVAVGLVGVVAGCGGGGSSSGATDQRPTGPRLALSASTVTFPPTDSGTAVPAAVVVGVTNAGDGTLAAPTVQITYGLGEAGWLDASVAPSGAGFTLTLRPTTTALAAANLSALVQVDCAGADDSPGTVTVGWQVRANASPVVVVSPPALAFSGQLGFPDPASRTAIVRNGGGGSLAALGVAKDADWLDASLAGTTITVGVSTGSLAAGRHVGHVTVTSAGAVNSPFSFPVVLDVVQSTLQAAPAELAFGAVSGASPAPKVLTLTNVGQGVLAAPTVGGDQPWVRAWVSGTDPSFTVSVSVDTTGFPDGTYDAHLVVTSAGASNSPLQVPVHVVVGIPVLEVFPPVLLLTTSVGTSPEPRVITVTNAGAGLLDPAVAATPSWLSATISGAEPTYVVSVIADASGLASGLYQGSITISAAAGVTGSPASVALALVVEDTTTADDAFQTIAGLQLLKYAECDKASPQFLALENPAYLRGSLAGPIAAGRLAFVPEQARACAQATAAMSCAAWHWDDLSGWFADPPACSAYVVGLVPSSGTCNPNDGSNECSNGTCVAADPLACGGTCTPYAAIGDPCTTGCGPGAQCQSNGTTNVCTTIQPPATEGQPCADTEPACATGLYCSIDSQTCLPWGGLGEACPQGNACREGLACQSGTCRPVVGRGESCADAVCGTWLVCDTSAGTTCVDPYAGPGESCATLPCAGWWHCRASDQICVEGTVPVGGTCDATASFCVAGASCNASSKCESNVPVCP